MQILLKFKCNNAVLPLAHKHHVQSLIYSMTASDKEYADFLHNQGYSVGYKKFKLFTFGDLYGKYEVQGKNITFLSEFILQVRSPDVNFINAVIRSASINKRYRLCGNDIILYDFSIESKAVFDNEIKIKTLSPITVYITDDNGGTRYFSPMEDEFYTAVEKNVSSKLLSVGKTADADFKIRPVSNFTPRNKTVTLYKNIYITAWNGLFMLQSDPEVLSFLYDTGIGAKNSQGFGMFDIVT